MAKGKDSLLQKGPGDVKETPKILKCRGDSGTSDAKGSEEGEVEYGR